MLIALIVIAISLARFIPAPTWLGWYTLAFILLFDSAYAWSCEFSRPWSLHYSSPRALRECYAIALPCLRQQSHHCSIRK